MKKGLCFLIITLIVVFCGTTVDAENIKALDITNKSEINVVGYSNSTFLTDGNINTYKKSSKEAKITLTNADGISGIYLLIDGNYGEFTITDNSAKTTLNTMKPGISHRYISLSELFGANLTDVTLEFEKAVSLSEIYLFSDGELPDFVQDWEPSLDKGADLALFSTHGDDEQLYFSGLLPLYAGERGLRVQVIYMTYHPNSPKRLHEMLNGLWAVGVRNYPVFGDFADFRIDDKEQTYKKYASLGTTKEELQAFVVEQIRRFKPIVAIGHDVNGEYGHGMHKVYSELLRNGIVLANNSEEFTDSYEKYGTWQVKKTYLHLYRENKITLDYDTPLNAFDGMTAFEVSQKLGFPCHKTQQWDVFCNWLYGKNHQITKATQIKTYSPCDFGLFQSEVGDDILKNDFFENVQNYTDLENVPSEPNNETEEIQPETSTNPEVSNDNLGFVPIVVIVLVLSAVIIFIILAIKQNYKN